MTMRIFGATPARWWQRAMGFAFVAALGASPLTIHAQGGDSAAAVETVAPITRALEPGVTGPWLWRIGPADSEKPSYLFGTIHLPDERVTTFPQPVEDAFESADVVYTEIPMSTLAQLSIASKVMLPAGESLSELLPDDLEARVAELYMEYGVDLKSMDRMKIWVVMTQAATLDYMQDLATKSVLDKIVWDRAGTEGKQRGALETVDSQVAVFETLTVEDQIQLFEDSMDQLEKYKAEGKKSSQVLLEAYLSGDSAQLVDQLIEEYDPEDELTRRFMQVLILDRDVKMSEKIAELIESNPDTSYFFAIGALHMPRDNGVVSLLREKGLEVERVTDEASSATE